CRRSVLPGKERAAGLDSAVRSVTAGIKPAARRGTLHLATRRQRYRGVALGIDHAQEPERFRGGHVAELVRLVRGDVNRVAEGERVDRLAQPYLAPAAQDHDRVLVAVALVRAEPARG